MNYIGIYIIRKLLTYANITEPEDIGIISPYHAQVCKIRKVLKSLPGQTNAKDIKVGSVEEFQGQVLFSRFARQILDSDNKI